MAGFISGGREGLPSSWSAATFVSIIFDCRIKRVSVAFTCIYSRMVAHLPICELKDQFDFVPLDVLRFHL